MNKTKHLFLKLFILLMFGVGWSSSAWAQRFTPTFVANYTADGPWYGITFWTSSNYYKAQGANQNLTYGTFSKTNEDHLWQLVGTQTSFKLVTKSGLYAKWNNTQYIGVSNADDATLFSLIDMVNRPDYWGIHRLTAGNNRVWNPIGNLVKEYHNDDNNSSVKFIDPNYVPKIVHRRAYFYDKYDANISRPTASGHIGADGNGWVTNAGVQIQKTAEYRIPVYLKQGTSRQLYLPTQQVQWYQRWYNYDTEGKVDSNVFPALYNNNFKEYSNGHVSGGYPGRTQAYYDSPTFTLPVGKTSYNVAMDISRFKDLTASNSNGDFVEPTLSQRVIFEIKDANEIANKLEACTSDKWFESRRIIFPTIKRGASDNNNTHQDVLPIDMDLLNYWAYDGSTLVQLQNRNQIEVVVENNTAKIQGAQLISATGDGTGAGAVDFNRGHFVRFEYPTGMRVDNNSTATVKVYFKVSATKKVQLAKFDLVFQDGVEPKLITEVMGSTRSPYWYQETYGNPLAEITFDNTNVLMRNNPPTGGVDKEANNMKDVNTYLYPLDFSLTNYAYGFERGDATSRGEYSIYNNKNLTGANLQRFKPVQWYYDKMLGTTTKANNNQFYIYVDASDQAGEVMSLNINKKLCAGTRLYVLGWMASTAANANPSSILINIVGKNSTNSEVITSYCPGMLSAWAYTEDGEKVLAMNPTANADGTYSLRGTGNGNDWALWNQVAFSFLLDNNTAVKYDSYQIQIYSNCYNSSGADYVLDNFQVFANPPKANADFTTPLCSDKTRHVRIYTDFDMIMQMANLNETTTVPNVKVTYAFLDQELFDNYQEPGLGVKVGEMFAVDALGNHNLKSNYNISDTKVANAINHAFRESLVGSRFVKNSGHDDYGFHTMAIPTKYKEIKPYAYNDSMEDEIYKDSLENGTRYVVFKENVIRGEMEKMPADTINNVPYPAYWPYMRTGRTYYLLFHMTELTQSQINAETVATNIFGLQDECSYFGEFTTPESMHVILDNADIESDLPVEAVCHGDEVTLSFKMPALKENKPIYDMEYCISDDKLDGIMVPESHGLHHYRYESQLADNTLKETIVNMQYDIWMGGLQKVDNAGTYRGTYNDYMEAVHPTKTYNHNTADPSHTHTHPNNYKEHGKHVNISQAMRDFRFFYPNFKEGDNWNEVTTHDYDNDSGYSFLNSEKEAIMDLVEKGIIVLRQNNFSMSKNFDNAEPLTDKERNEALENEMHNQILSLALKLDDEQAIADLLPLKALEGAVLGKLTRNEDKIRLTFEEYGNFTVDQLKVIADNLKNQGHLTQEACDQLKAMSVSDLRKNLESVLRGLDNTTLLDFAKNYFPNIGHEKRAYLVVRALNILSNEIVAANKDASVETIRGLQREAMISLFKSLNTTVLVKMWGDVSAKLTAEDVKSVLNLEPDPRNPDTMDKTDSDNNRNAWATLVEDALAKITQNVSNQLSKDRYVHFTLVPIMPSQENFVDQPYIICPEPRGVKVTLRNAAPQMLNGFGDMKYHYPETMKNVPVRAGVKQLDAVSRDISSTIPDDAKTLRIPLRGLVRALDEGVSLVPYEQTLGENKPIKTVFLVDTNDSAYEKELDKESETEEEMKLEAWGKVRKMVADFGKTDNYMELVFNKNYPMREGHTYRIGVRFVEEEAFIDDSETDEEKKKKKRRDIACDGVLYFDLKVVPEYQVWTGKESGSEATNWTNDHNWARADRSELLADGTKTGDVISASTAFANAANYRANETNFGDKYKAGTYGFMPMYFTNVLFNDSNAMAPIMVKPDNAEGAFLAFNTGTGDNSLQVPNKAGNRSGFENHTMIDHKLPKSVAFLRNDTVANSKIIYSIAYDMAVAPVGTDGQPLSKDGNTRYTTAFANQNYMCEPFFTNVAKGVTFAPQTQLINAQYLSYYKAWVEYELKVNRWYTLGSPLQNTFAGEWYAPTDGAKQLSPYFYGIEYKTNLNHRFRPAIYQRSWDSNGHVHVYKKTGGDASWGTNDEPAYVKADWSYVYNDVLKEYSEGGFSVKVNTDLMTSKPTDEKSIIRLPKADTKYTYYDSEANTGQQPDGAIPPTATNRGRLWSDKFTESVTEFSQTITNRSDGNNGTVVNNFFLVNNPFIANMDMKEFFAKNTQFEKKYWIMTDKGQLVKVQVTGANGPTWVSADGSGNFANADAKVGPLQGFFVKANTDTNTTDVKFTAAMQATTGASKAIQTRAASTSATINQLAIHASRNGYTSTAVVALSDKASNEFKADEDAQTFVDGNVINEPTLYTVASGQAMTINTLSKLEMLPLGIISEDDSEVTLTFDFDNYDGTELQLFDAETRQIIDLTPDTELTVSGNNSNRYFIAHAGTLGLLDERMDDQDARIYNLHGMQIGTAAKGTIVIINGEKRIIK